MDLANLNAFILVAETGSFSLAGERLGLTQPAVSKRIAALEQQLGVRLFDRVARDIGLTEAGRALLPRAQRIRQELQDTRRALGNLNSRVEGQLSLATSHHIGLHRLPPVLRNFAKTYPKVTLDIQFLDSEVAYEKVLHGQVELAVVTLAPQTHPPLSATPVWLDRLAFVAAPLHPLAQLTRVELAQIAAHPAVLPSDRTFTQRIVRRLFSERSLRLDLAMTTNYLETIKMLVSIGQAWSVLPGTLLDDQVLALPVNGLHLERRLGYLFHQERTLSNAARAFMALLDDERAAQNDDARHK